MDIQVLSFGLAVLLGVLCFGLVKHTADEFDRWYLEPRPLKIPAFVGAIATFVLVALFIFTR